MFGTVSPSTRISSAQARYVGPEPPHTRALASPSIQWSSDCFPENIREVSSQFYVVYPNISLQAHAANAQSHVASHHASACFGKMPWTTSHDPRFRFLLIARALPIRSLAAPLSFRTAGHFGSRTASPVFLLSGTVRAMFVYTRSTWQGNEKWTSPPNVPGHLLEHALRTHTRKVETQPGVRCCHPRSLLQSLLANTATP